MRKQKRNRIISLILVFVMALTMTGAGFKSDRTEESTSALKVSLYDTQNGTLSFTADGTVTEKEKVFSKEDTVIFYAIPDDGYELKDIVVRDEEAVRIETKRDGNKILFVMPGKNVGIVAEFTPRSEAADDTGGDIPLQMPRLSAGNAAAEQTVSEALGISGMNVIQWLKSHENDDYYIGTPYKYKPDSNPYAGFAKSSDWRNPHGDPTGYGLCENQGEGMQCTGFVWHVLVSAGAAPTDVPHLGAAHRGTASYGWYRFVTSNNIKHYEYTTKQAMLNSGVLEKGDIIMSFDNSTGGVKSISNYHHIGFFWGNRSNEDKYWHSGPVYDANTTSEINGITAINRKISDVTWWVIKLGYQQAPKPVDAAVTEYYWQFPEDPVISSAVATAARDQDMTMTISVTKTDSVTGNPVKDAEFVVSMDGKYYDQNTFKTDEDGVGTYTWTWRKLRTWQHSAQRKYVANYDKLSAADKTWVNNQSNLWHSYSGAKSAAQAAADAIAQQELDTILNEMHTWTITEVSAPDNYKAVNTTFSKSASFRDASVSFDVMNDEKTYVHVKKVSSRPTQTILSEDYSLEGAVYGIYKTKADAKTDRNRYDILTTNSDGTSDKLEIEPGTWYIREIEASKGFFICDGSEDEADEDGIHTVSVTKYSDTEFVCTEPLPYRGSIKVIKLSDDGADTPLEGVGFKLFGLNTKETFTGTTDANGEILWEELEPQTYALTETNTIEGYTLLADNVEITIPMEMTEAQAAENGADLSKAVYDKKQQKYYFYNVSCTVQNGEVFRMPVTGGNTNRMIWILAAAFALVGMGIFMMTGKNGQNRIFDKIAKTDFHKI